VANPVDMLASASPEQYAEGLRLLLADEHVDGVLLILPPPPMYTAVGVAEAIIPIIQAASKPVVVALMGHNLILEARDVFAAARIPAYPFPETAASALAALAERAKIMARAEKWITPLSIDVEKARQVLETAGQGWLAPQQIDELLQAYGIPRPAMALAQTAKEAANRAAAIGFPVALKIASADIVHKSDVGGIAVDLASGEAVEGAFREMVARSREIYPAARLEGVQVQGMVGGGQEVIAGIGRDAQFGPLVMFGSGGVEVEGLQDVAFELAPLTWEAAQRLLQETWAGTKLAGFRHLPAADQKAVLDVLIRLGQMAQDLPQLAEIEINPLIVLAEGATAVDVRARLS
jgi:acetyltransferase